MARYFAPRGMADAKEVIEEAAGGSTFIDDLGKVIDTVQRGAETYDAIEQVWTDTPAPASQNYDPASASAVLPDDISVQVGKPPTDYTPWLIGGGIVVAVIVAYMMLK